MSLITLFKFSEDNTNRPGVSVDSGSPESSLMIGATRVSPNVLAIASPVTLRTWLCLPVVKYGPFDSIVPFKIRAVV